MALKPLILVIGSSNVDMIMKLPRLPKVGETVTDGAFIQTFGGKGANQAVAAAKAGGNVAFVNCVGDDPLAEQVVQNLKANQVDVNYMLRERGVTTGTALVMIGEQGTNYLAVAPGANYRLSKSHIGALEKLISEASVIILQFEILSDTLYYTLDVCARKGKQVIFNFAPPQAIDASQLQKVHTLMLNETEASFLTNIELQTNAAIEKAAKALKQMGPVYVIITLGSKGAYFIDESLQGTFLPAFKVAAVDTTAAGDTFAGAYATALMDGQNPIDAIRFASAASALSVTKMGAQPSIPNRKEIEAFLQTHI